MSKRAEDYAWEEFPNYGDALARLGAIKGYEQAEKDYIELAQLWVGSGDANIMSFKQFLKCHETQSNK